MEKSEQEEKTGKGRSTENRADREPMYRIYERFCHCMERVADAERERNWKKLHKWVEEAGKLPIVVPWQSWLFRYSDTIMSLLYEKYETCLDDDTFLKYEPFLTIETMEGLESYRHDENTEEQKSYPYNESMQDRKYRMSRRLIALRREALQNPVDILSMVKGLEDYQRLLLHFLQKNFENMELFPEYEEIALEFQELVEEGQCEMIELPAKKHFSNAILGEYYITFGKAQLSRKYFERVWNLVSEQEIVDSIVFFCLSKSLYSYQMSGEIEKLGEYTERLYRMVEENRVRYKSGGWEEMLYRASVQKVITFKVIYLQMAGCKEQAVKYAQSLISKKWHVSEEIQSDGTVTAYLAYLNALDQLGKRCERSTFLRMKRFFRRYQRMDAFQGFPPWLRAHFFHFGYLLFKQTKGKGSAACVRKMEQILLGEPFPEADRTTYLNLMKVLIEIRSKQGEMERVRYLVERMFHQLLRYYMIAEYYSENECLEKYLGICRLSFQYAYESVWELSDCRHLLEYSMNFKNILSSAIRYRNSLLASDGNEEPKTGEIRYIVLEELMNRIPEQTALLDFVYLDPRIKEEGTLYTGRGKLYNLAVFAVIRGRGQTEVRQFVIPDDRKLQKCLEDCAERLREVGRKTDEILKKIYEILLEPLQEELKELAHIWLCADGELWNLPFEMVIAQGRDWKCEDVIYWQSLRDLCENRNTAGAANRKMCAIGDPDFKWGGKDPKDSSDQKGTKVPEDEKRTKALEDDKGGKISPDEKGREEKTGHLHRLMFSGYEVRKAADIMGGDSYTGKLASKDRVTCGYQYLHVATHGILEEGEGAEWERSALVFSGTNHDAILTAGEISRMQMDGTELVVLSACRSGNSLFSEYRQQAGLHVAFGVAGVSYIISALWKVDDLASALLMGFFYEAVSEDHTIPKALWDAKRRLCRLRMDELYRILSDDCNRMEEGESDELLQKLSALPDDYTIFSSPYYWGGFICYQTNTQIFSKI